MLVRQPPGLRVLGIYETMKGATIVATYHYLLHQEAEERPPGLRNRSQRYLSSSFVWAG